MNDMKESELFLALIIIGFVLGVIGFSAITGSIGGAAVYETQFTNYHTKCVNGQCVGLAGPGNSECTEHMQCNHLECRNYQCVVITEPGTNWCNTNLDCY